jgi:DNA-binding response OmpR family regulator
MRRKSIYSMSDAELETFSTRRLLARLRQLLRREDSVAHSDCLESDDKPEGKIEFKQTEEWKHAYQQVKKLLANREHLER